MGLISSVKVLTGVWHCQSTAILPKRKGREPLFSCNYSWAEVQLTDSSAVAVKLSNCSLEKLVLAALDTGKTAYWL